MYVRNDTVYASAGLQGLYVFKLTASNTFTLLGSLTGYADVGYNHSSFLTKDGKTLVFCDESQARSIKIADVTNLNNITLSALTKPNNNPEFIAHNPYILGNKWAFVSCYQEGLLLYDISTPTNPILKGFFDSFPSGGANAGNNYGGTSYRGNWGAYPFFPSGVILVCDMQNGIFLLEANALLGTNIGIKEENINLLSGSIYPNPVNERLRVTFINNSARFYTIEISNLLGQLIYSETNLNDCQALYTNKTIDVSRFEAGSYVVNVKADNKQLQKKIIITK
jgi:hypothetical protein